MSYPNAMKGEPCSQNTLRIQCVNQATGFPDRTSRRYHDAFAFTSNQDLKMAQPLPGMKPRPDQALSLNMKLLSHHELQGFGGIGEGMGMQLARDGRRILWLAHESAPKNFTAVDVTDPKNPRVVVQTELPHAKVRSNSDRKSTRLNSSHGYISYAVFCLKKKKNKETNHAIITIENTLSSS